MGIPEPQAHRVTLYNPIPTGDAAPTVTLGGGTPGTSATLLNEPYGAAMGGGRVVVADTLNRRVLLWNSIPTTNGAPADLVLGQPDFTTSASGPASASTFSQPWDVWTDGERLAVVDATHHRILFWDSWPTSDQQPADHVLGQPSFDTSSPAAGPAGLNQPAALSVYGGQLFVADGANHRVLVYARWPQSNGESAIAVIGQPDFTTATPGISDRALRSPSGARVVNGRLAVTDLQNNRVLFY